MCKPAPVSSDQEWKEMGQGGNTWDYASWTHPKIRVKEKKDKKKKKTIICTYSNCVEVNDYDYFKGFCAAD